MTALDYRPSAAIPLSALIVSAAAGLVNAGIASAGRALGVDGSLPGIQPIAFLTLTIAAALAGAVGWHLVNRGARRPGRVLRWLVPTFLAVSFIPDVLMGVSFGWPYAFTLASMHVATIAIAVAVYWRLLPVTDRGRTPNKLPEK